MTSINTKRSPRVQKDYENFLLKFTKKNPTMTHWLLEEAVDILRNDYDIQIERFIEPTRGLVAYIAKNPYPWDNQGVTEYLIYIGTSDLPLLGLTPELADPKNPRYKTFLDSITMVTTMVAATVAARSGYSSYVIVTNKEFDIPIVKLLVYK